MSIMDNVVGCKTCGTAIVFVRTEDEKVIPVNADATMVAIVEEKDGVLVAQEKVEGHQPHWQTCQEPASKPTDGANAKPEELSEEDTCPECDHRTKWRKWLPPGETVPIEFWDCTAKPSCGKYWKKGTGAATWKPADPDRIEDDRSRRPEVEEESDTPF